VKPATLGSALESIALMPHHVASALGIVERDALHKEIELLVTAYGAKAELEDLIFGFCTAQVPLVNMGVTLGVGSDCYPYTVTRVHIDGNRFWMRRDDYRRSDKNGMSESQEYDYFPKAGGREDEVVKDRSGGWKIRGGSRVHLGSRRAYQDPHV